MWQCGWVGNRGVHRNASISLLVGICVVRLLKQGRVGKVKRKKKGGVGKYDKKKVSKRREGQKRGTATRGKKSSGTPNAQAGISDYLRLGGPLRGNLGREREVGRKGEAWCG